MPWWGTKTILFFLLSVYIDLFMLRIIYKSKQRRSFSESEFDELCECAKVNNAACGVTGLLLRNQNEFLQCIEGPVKEVSATFKRICRDPRHFDIQVLEVKRILKRMFAQWSMYGVDHSLQDLTSLKNPSDKPTELPPLKLKRTWGRSGMGLAAFMYEHEQVYKMLEKRGELHLLPQVLPFLSK